MKRFFVNSITRDKEYDLTTGKKGSKLHYFSAHPNGEREVVTIHLKARTHLKKLKLDVDLGEQDRKSTRLNSSHVRISYAVFCLKKKKKKKKKNNSNNKQ